MLTFFTTRIMEVEDEEEKNDCRPYFCRGLDPWLGALSASADGPLRAPESEITIVGQKPAHFSHPVHLRLGLDCGICHHDGEHQPLSAEAIAILPDSKGLDCGGCHNSAFGNSDPQRSKDVFHARCLARHKAGYEGKSGPTGCVGCHVKKVKKAVEGC